MNASSSDSSVFDARDRSACDQQYWNRLVRWCQQLRSSDASFAADCLPALSASTFDKVDTDTCVRLVAEFLKCPLDRLVKVQCALCVVHKLCHRSDIVSHATGTCVDIVSSSVEHINRFVSHSESVKAVHCTLSGVVHSVVSLNPSRLSCVYVCHLVKLLLASGRSLEVQRELLGVVNQLLEECDRPTRTNLRHLLGDHLSQMVVVLEVCGDYDVQCSVVECLMRFSSRADRPQLAEQWFPTWSQGRNLFVRIRSFDIDCRIFLNAFNARLGSVRLVHSFPAVDVCLADFQIRKPRDENYTDFWVDFNEGSGTIFIYCDRFVNESLPQDGAWDVVLVRNADVIKARLHMEANIQVVKLVMSMSWQQSLPPIFADASKDFFKLSFNKNVDVHSVLNRIFLGKYKFIAPCLSPLANVKTSVTEFPVKSTSSVSASVHNALKSSEPVHSLHRPPHQPRPAKVKRSSPVQSLQLSIQSRSNPAEHAADGDAAVSQQHAVSSDSVISGTQQSPSTTITRQLPQHTDRAAVASSGSSATLVASDTTPDVAATTQNADQHVQRDPNTTVLVSTSPVCSKLHTVETAEHTAAINTLKEVGSISASSQKHISDDGKPGAKESTMCAVDHTGIESECVEKSAVMEDAMANENVFNLDKTQGDAATAVESGVDEYVEQRNRDGDVSAVVFLRKRSLYSSTDKLIELEAHSQSDCGDHSIVPAAGASFSYPPLSNRSTAVKNKYSGKRGSSINNTAKRARRRNDSTKSAVVNQKQTKCSRKQGEVCTDGSGAVTDSSNKAPSMKLACTDTSAIHRPCRTVARNKCYLEQSDSSSDGVFQSNTNRFESRQTDRNRDIACSAQRQNKARASQVKRRPPRAAMDTSLSNSSSFPTDANASPAGVIDEAAMGDSSVEDSANECRQKAGTDDQTVYRGIFDNASADDLVCRDRNGRGKRTTLRQRSLLFTNAEQMFDSLAASNVDGGGDSGSCRGGYSEQRPTMSRASYSGRRALATVRNRSSFRQRITLSTGVSDNYKKSLRLWSIGLSGDNRQKQAEIMRHDGSDSDNRTGGTPPPAACPSLPADKNNSSSSGSATSGLQLIGVAETMQCDKPSAVDASSPPVAEIQPVLDLDSGDCQRAGEQSVECSRTALAADQASISGKEENACIFAQGGHISSALLRSLQMVGDIKKEHSRTNERIDSLKLALQQVVDQLSQTN